MDRDIERALVERLREGDHGAFDAVFDLFHARLHGFLSRLSRSRDVADDLLDETWLRLVTHGSRLRPDTQLGPWLFTVARNLYVSYCRSRCFADAHRGELGGLWPAGSPSPSPFEETAANELERRVEQALAALPPRDREVLLLVAVEGFSPSEAARICGVRPEAMRQRLSRARALLDRGVREPRTTEARALREVTS